MPCEMPCECNFTFLCQQNHAHHTTPLRCAEVPGHSGPHMCQGCGVLLEWRRRPILAPVPSRQDAPSESDIDQCQINVLEQVAAKPTKSPSDQQRSRSRTAASRRMNHSASPGRSGRSIVKDQAPQIHQEELALAGCCSQDTVPVQLSLLNGTSWEITMDGDGTIGQLLARFGRLCPEDFEVYCRRGVIIPLGTNSSPAGWRLQSVYTRIMKTKWVRDQIAAGRPVSFQLILLEEHSTFGH